MNSVGLALVVDSARYERIRMRCEFGEKLEFRKVWELMGSEAVIMLIARRS
jgi:hypothetical protein